MRNFILLSFQFFKEMYFFVFYKLIGKFDAGIDIFKGKLREIVFGGDFLRLNAGAEKIQYLPDHNSMPLDARFAMADIGIYRYSFKHDNLLLFMFKDFCKIGSLSYRGLTAG